MKENALAALLVILCGLTDGFGQSSFELANKHTPLVDAPVFDSGGVALAGTNYFAELWGGATPSSLAPLTVIEQGNSREVVPFLGEGYFIPARDAGSLCVVSVAPRGWAWLRVRAWDARLGGTYETVAALRMGGCGESSLFYAQGNNPLAVPPDIPAPLLGLQSFSLAPIIPEPATWALLALCGTAVWWTRRRQAGG
jgi:hypothetical protein